MNTRTLIALAGGALLGTLALAAAADQIYKWVDKDGHVHYSQTPPPATGVQAQSVDIGAPPPDPTTLHNEQNLAKQLDDKNKQAQDVADKQKQDAQQKAQQKAQCDDLRDRLRVLQAGGRAATVDANGNMNFLSDDDRAKREKELQDDIDKNCSGA